MSRIILLLILSAFTSQMFGQTDIPGCTISVACNYNSSATINDGSCDFITCFQMGCTDPDACNYDVTAAINNGSCDYTSCLVAGCMLELACNYNPDAEISNGTCEFISCAGCMDVNAPNYDATATIDDGSCESILGCVSSDACNYNSLATEDDGTCEFTSCLVLGCTDITACNYDEDADISDGSCSFASEGFNCAGACLIDTDGDGVCDQFEIEGCDDSSATNYSSDVTENNGSCVYPIPGCTSFEACNYDSLADLNDGSCEFTSCSGCTSSDACNYDSTALYSDDSCTYPELFYDCDGNCLVDTDGDGVCDALEIVGCTDVTACSYSSEATDSGSCSFPLINYDCDGNNLQPIFTVSPADITVQGWEVDDIDDVVLEAIISPYAAAYESQYLGNNCYDAGDVPNVVIAGEVKVDGNCIHDYTLFRSWTAIDCAGYSSTVYQTLTVVDTVPPILFTPLDMSISCDLVDGAEFGTASGTDDCGEVTITVDDEIVLGTCLGSYQIIRTFTGTDPCENTTTGTQIITVTDDEAPIITPPSDFTVECSDAIQYFPATATDNCGVYTISSNESTIDGTSPGSYSIIRTFVAFDDCGNSNTVSQTITVVDTTAPLLVIPSDYTAECSDALVYATATAIDACGTVEISVVDELIPGNAAGNYTIVRTFTATDIAGNTSLGIQTITVEDTTAPIIEAPDNFTVECDEFLRLDDPLATDNCGEVTITSTDVTILGDEAGNYVVIRTFIATDDADNVSYPAIQTINVVDTTSPELTVPSGYTVECSDEIVIAEATATDNCGDVVITTYQQTIFGNSAGNYSIYCEFTATDDSGNSTVAVQIIEVVDTTAPVLSIPSDYTAECSDDLVLAAASSIDNCGEVTLTLSTQTVDGDATGNYTLIRTFTATDDAGNATSASQTITVQDTTSPELSIPADFTVECSDTIDLDAATVSDNCGTVELSVVEETVSGSSVGFYSIVRTFTAIDDAGNTSSAIQTITVFDNTAPVLLTPSNYTAECSDELLMEDATATDNCSATSVTVSVETLQGASSGNYILLRTFTATDESGNVITSTQTITVQDTTAPELTIPSNYTVECSEAIILNEASATDNCSAVTISLDELTVPGSSAGNYTIVRTFTANDESTNSTTAVQTITVVDTTAPDLTIPSDYTVECSDEIILNEASAVDNCGSSSILLNEQTIPGSSVGNYSIVREFTATDDAGNEITLTQTITVVDTSAPVFSNVAENLSVECTDVEDSITPTIEDNCSEVNIVFEETSVPGPCEGEYTLTRTWTASDSAGNSSDATQTIIVTDNTAPEFIVLEDIDLSCSEAVIIPEPELLPGCSEESFTVVEVIIPGDCPQSYSIVRTYLAIDACGNTAEFIHTTNIIDNTAPVVTDGTCFGLECAIAIDGLQGESIPAAYISISDDCDDAPTWSSSDVSASSDDLATLNLSGDQSATTRTFTLIDACGNESVLYQTFILTFVLEGCTDLAACNYNSVANTEDNSCDYCSCELYNCGCMDSEACNFDSIAIYDDESCEYPVPGFDCDGVCFDVNNNGVCDIEESGCTDAYACNYNSGAQVDDGSCDYCNCSIEPQLTSSNSDYSIEIELVTTHSSVSLAGKSTYRVYVNTPNTTDIVSAVTGNDNFPLSLATTTTFYQNVFGSNSATSISPSMMSVAPDAEYDSWITIGATSSADVAGGVINIMPGSWVTEFSAGNSFTVNDGVGSGWYLLPPSGSNGLSGPDQRVLLTQLTTDGEISGSFSVQIFPEGDPTDDDRVDFTFSQAPLGNFSCPIIIDGPSEITAECSSVPAISSSSDFTVYNDPAIGCDLSDISIELLSEEIILEVCAGDYTIVRVLGITNCAGSTTNFTQTITIIDTTSPVLTIPSDYTAECSDAHPMDAASATDNCSELISIEVVEWIISGNAIGNYEIVREFTAIDECGNYSSAIQVITIVDTTAPVFTSIPADYSAECSDEMPLDEAIAFDDCGSVVVTSFDTLIQGDCPNSYQLIRTFTAIDDAGNFTVTTQTITVEDTTAPVFSFTPAADVLLNVVDGDVMPDPFVLVLDACDIEPMWNYVDLVLEETATTITTQRTYTVTDDCGNSSTFVQTIVYVSLVTGCMDADACNYNPDANQDNGTCAYPQYAYDCDGNCINDVNENDICDELEILGCTDPDNPGYNPSANFDDGSCLFGGCVIPFACNYDVEADYQLAGSCEFTSCSGCTDDAACNYDNTATLNNGSCIYSNYGYDCNGGCVNDTDGDGICDEFEVLGCTDSNNPGYNSNATDDDGSCLVGGCVLPFACNYNPDADYLIITDCDFASCAGCMDATSCSYDPNATINSSYDCTYPTSQFLDCNGECVNDTDGDGVCDEEEVPGCTDIAANNYNVFATDDDGSCVVLTGGCSLPFACNYDPSADFYLPGSCDFSCLFGMPMGGACADPLACNYGEEGNCEYFDANGELCATVGCMDDSACNYDPEAQIQGVCDYISCESYGCDNINACNYDSEATINDGSCEYTSCLGCTDPEASNYDPTATVDNNTCEYEIGGCMNFSACNYNPDATYDDDSCEYITCFGCASPSACNYDPSVIYPDGSCVFADPGSDCDGNCLQDADADGVCDADEIGGCTDVDALNYSSAATEENGTCIYPAIGCTDQTACNFDFTAIEEDGSCEYTSCSGCLIPSACNYNPDATLSDGTCEYPDAEGNCDGCASDVDGDGICDEDELAGCIYATASNYDASATDDDGSCQFYGCVDDDYSSYNAYANENEDCTNTPSSADFNGDGIVQLEDLLEFLIAFGQSGPDWSIDWVNEACGVTAIPLDQLIDVDEPGCTYVNAANYDSSAIADAGNCAFTGCTDSEAMNFNPLANIEDSSCSYNVCPDFNGDGVVQAEDLLDFLISWGTIYE